MEEFLQTIKNNNYAYAFSCGNNKCEENIKNISNASLRCIPFENQNIQNNNCFCCNKKAKYKAIFAKSY